MKIKSFAKVNLSLKIIWKVENWYHLIDSIFNKISLADEIIFEDKKEWIEIRTTWEFRKIPTNAWNTCFKIADKMRKFAKWKRWIKIILQKNIPQKAGLWWWSSNAGEVLKYLNKHWEINFDEEKLIEIWASVWADIPFFIKKWNCQKVGWIWEKTEEIFWEFSWKYIAIIKPKYIEIETKWAYEILDKSWKDNFEEAIFSYFPDLKRIKNELKNSWAIKANMTWSGSCIFWIFENENIAKKSLEKIEGIWWSWVFLIK